MKNTPPTIEERQAGCKKYNGVLPSKSLQEIEKETGLPYTFIYRTMNGQFKRWEKEKHGVVLSAAEKVLKKMGLKFI